MRVHTENFENLNTQQSREPRFVVEISFTDTHDDLVYFPSHADADLPGGAVSIADVVENISGTSQQLNPDKAVSSIGLISFSLTNANNEVSDLLATKFQADKALKDKRVRIYVGFKDLAWADYALVQTQLISKIQYAPHKYDFSCADIQRAARRDIFDLAKTNLSSSISASDSTIPVFVTAEFTLVEHGTSNSDAPSSTVGYVQIEDEFIRYTGKTSTTFTGCTRGVLNSKAVEHNIDSAASADRRTPVIEYVYLEMPAVKLAYALLTGDLYGQSATLPDSWHLGIDTNYVRLTDFTDSRLADWWDTADDTAGVNVRFDGLKKQDGKKFIEKELLLLLGAFSPVYSDGALGFRRMTRILYDAAYVKLLDETNIISHSALVHNFDKIFNFIQIDWNWISIKEKFSRNNILLDSGSIALFGLSKPFNVKFRGLNGARHTLSTLYARFSAFRDRFTGPPETMNVKIMPSSNTVEVGDVVRVQLDDVDDYEGGSTLDRSFEVQRASVDWDTGEMELSLFGSTQTVTTSGVESSAAAVLPDSYYSSEGRNLATWVDSGFYDYTTDYQDVSGVGHIIADSTIRGDADIQNASGAIYYHLGDLIIDSGITLTITKNIQLRVMGHLTINGTINGSAQGQAGTSTAAGTIGHSGITKANGGVKTYVGRNFGQRIEQLLATERPITDSGVQALEHFDIAYNPIDGIVGMPLNLWGTSGGRGGNYKADTDFHRLYWWRYVTTLRATGGGGGLSGSGFITISRGTSFGASGEVNLSGGDGALGASADPFGSETSVTHAGSGAGGSSGNWLILLDGTTAIIPNTLNGTFVATHGSEPLTVSRMPAVTCQGKSLDITSSYPLATDPTTSYYSGYSDTPVSEVDTNHRIIFIPEYVVPEEDSEPTPPPSSEIQIAIAELAVSNWTEQANPKNFWLRSVTWNGTIFCAVGDADGTDSYIVTSTDGITWIEQANPKNFGLQSVTWNGTIFCAVGDADGTDAYVVTSSDGITWTERANPKNFGLKSVTWNGTIFCAVGSQDGTDAYLITSTDGITWTERANPRNTTLKGVAWNGTIFCAVGSNDGAGDSYVITSPDGITWIERANPKNAGLNCITWSGTIFCAAGDQDGIDTYIITSPDGITWAERGNPKAISVYSITWSGIIFCAVGSVSGDPDGYIITSPDGITWTERTNPKASILQGVTWGESFFCAVGANDGTDAYIITSLNQ